MHRKLALCFVSALCWTLTLQCYCPRTYTQKQICDADLVIKATINSVDNNSDPRYRTFGITIDEVIHGGSFLNQVSDKSTLSTPQSQSECGPLNLEIGVTYIFTPNMYMGRMTINVCHYVSRVSDLSAVIIGRITHGYRQNCDCEIPSPSSPPYMFRKSKDSCGRTPSICSGRDMLCKRDSYGRCYWAYC